MMLYVVEHYRDIYSELKGKELTDRLLVELLSRHCSPGAVPAAIRIERTGEGKPFVVWDEEIPSPHISVSHCDGVFACAVDDDNVGLDIQDERDVDVERIGNRYFNEDEQKEDFYVIWTRKEAYSKFTGIGLSQVISGVTVLGRQDVNFEEFTILDNIHVSVCRPAPSAGERGDYEIRFFDGKQNGSSRNRC